MSAQAADYYTLHVRHLWCGWIMNKLSAPEVRQKTIAIVLDGEFRRHPPLIMNERELAFVTCLSVRGIRSFTKRGLIPRIKIGRSVRYRWPQVEAALARMESKAA
jgi:hypothetical protein